MKIIVDAFGGDNAPRSVLEGAVLAASEFKAEISVVGDTSKIIACAKENGIDIGGIAIIDADSEISMHDDPGIILKAKKDSSMAVGLQCLAEGGADAFVSAGSTGALLMGGTFIVKRIKGIKRPALAAIVPSATGCFMLVDCGANVEARPEMLVQFAQMGSVYMALERGVKNPRVGLVNNGAEETKGTDMLRETYRLLSETKNINFIGNIEGRDAPLGACDVAVADGFVGNIMLKTMEGLGKAMYDKIKAVFMKNAVSKLAAVTVKGGLKDFKHSMDSSEYGGAPLLGLQKTVIKAHGNSDARAIKNAIRQAIGCCEADVPGNIEKGMSE